MTTTCQICGRAILANTGLIARHGYKRPGHGWQTSSCMGARYRPYEIACDAIPLAIEAINAFLDRERLSLAAWIANPPERIAYQRKDAWGSKRGPELILARPAGFDGAKNPGSYRPGSYESRFFSMAGEMRQSIKSAEADLEYLTKRLAAWVAPKAEG